MTVLVRANKEFRIRVRYQGRRRLTVRSSLAGEMSKTVWFHIQSSHAPFRRLGSIRDTQIKFSMTGGDHISQPKDCHDEGSCLPRRPDSVLLIQFLDTFSNSMTCALGRCFSLRLCVRMPSEESQSRCEYTRLVGCDALINYQVVHPYPLAGWQVGAGSNPPLHYNI